MDYLTPLRADYQRLASVASASEATPESKVPTCPDWTVNDLVNHVAHVYLHKVECMRHNAAPDPWPAPGLDQGPRLDLLHRAYGELSDEFAARAASSPTHTWYERDRTVGFWMRRMAHETVIHRIDAELAAGVPSQPVPDDLALDGIDELLERFLAWPSTKWSDEFEAVLEPKVAGSVGISAGDRRWLLSWSPSGLITAEPGGGAAEAEISGSPEAALRWLWRRSDGPISVTGDETKVDQLRRLLGAATG
ncbi:MAG TPA: maleylpyruvate isomerase family mycothiol-dependent enzyme [Candidatus Limnocylindrales bacterium]|nr:maleylpyruvate isomerase family mycothiol-dependent enzyme [Candidatus Limnocylindrales bacterium]